MSTTTTTHPAASRTRSWHLERALFALAGTVTLVSVGLGALVSPWFLLAAAAVGVSEWAFVLTGACPASILLRRFTGLRGCAR
jgi:hypothetical protein